MSTKALEACRAAVEWARQRRYSDGFIVIGCEVIPEPVFVALAHEAMAEMAPSVVPVTLGPMAVPDDVAARIVDACKEPHRGAD